MDLNARVESGYTILPQATNVGSRHLHEGSAYIVQPHASKLLDLQLVHKVVRSRYQSNPHCHFAHKIDKIIRVSFIYRHVPRFKLL